MFRTIATTALIAVTLLAAPAHADTPATEGDHMRFAETCVSVIQVDAVPRVAAAVNAWNASQDVVELYNRAVPGCAVIEVRAFEPGQGVLDAGGYVLWPQVAAGEWVGDQYLVHHAEVWVGRFEWTRCEWVTTVAHEIGHALGLRHAQSPRSVMSYDYNAERHCGRIFPIDVLALGSLYA